MKTTSRVFYSHHHAYQHTVPQAQWCHHTSNLVWKWLYLDQIECMMISMVTNELYVYTVSSYRKIVRPTNSNRIIHDTSNHSSVNTYIDCVWQSSECVYALLGCDTLLVSSDWLYHTSYHLHHITCIQHLECFFLLLESPPFVFGMHDDGIE